MDRIESAIKYFEDVLSNCAKPSGYCPNQEGVWQIELAIVALKEKLERSR